MSDTPLKTLATLITDYRDKTGDSYRDIARKTGLAKSTVADLAQGRRGFPVRIETIEKIAQGLHIPLQLVQEAAVGTSIAPGNRYGDTNSTQISLIIGMLTQLPQEDLDMVEALVRKMAAASQA